MQKTDLDMLEKEDDAAYLFGNFCTVGASCYECGLEHRKNLTNVVFVCVLIEWTKEF